MDLMDLTSQFKAICNDFPAFREAIAEARQYAHEPQVRDQLDRICKELDRTYADFQKKVPEGIAELERDIAESKRKMEEAKQLIPEAQAEIDAARKEIASMKVPELPALPGVAVPDPAHASRLRQELIERFFKSAKRPAARSAGEVVEMEDQDWSSHHS
jgi:septal ring factor EnvC (AmiA/AmiB activator)